MIRAITFDFWGTLYTTEPRPTENGRATLRTQKLGEYLNKTPYDLCWEEIKEHFLCTCQMFADLRLQGETAHTRDMILAFSSELGVEFSGDEIDDMTAILEQAAIDLPPKMTPHAVETVKNLSKNYKLGIVSDTGLTPGRVLRQIMANDSLLKYFDGFSFSDETMYRKPHPEQFLQVLEDLKVDPEEAVHVGDLIEADIVGAKAVGMKTILFAREQAPSAKTCEADFIIDDLGAIPSIISTLPVKNHVYGTY